MPDIDTDQLANLTTCALERTAFMLVDPADEIDPGALTRHTHITYTGPDGDDGEVFVSASEGFTIELASSLLGVEPNEVDADDHGADAMRELANILAGSILTTLGGAEHAFRLGLPENMQTPAPEDGCIICAMDSMGEPLIVSWRRKAA